MEPVPSTDLARADFLLRQGLPEPAELDDVAETAAAFSGLPVALALRGLAGGDPDADAALARGRPPGEAWTGLGEAQGRWLLDARGGVWGLLRVGGALSPRLRAGMDRAGRQLEALAARAQARRERRGASRGPALSSFVPGLVHELRNAAFGFSGILDAFEARHPDRAEAERYGGALRRQLEHLTGFIEEVGAYGDPRPAPGVPLALSALLREAAAHCQPQAERLGLDLRVAWDGAEVMVRADAANLRGAFTSLLRWALGQGGGVAVALRAGGGEDGNVATGWVEGPGLQAGGLDLARIFEPFYFRASGMGRLALPVARRTLEAHGGTLGAAPGPAGEVRLAFTLPCL